MTPKPAIGHYHIELLRIRDDGSIERRRFPPPFADMTEAVEAGEHYIRGTEFWFQVIDDEGNLATVRTNDDRVGSETA